MTLQSSTREGPQGTVSWFLGRPFKSHQTAKDSPGKPPPALPPRNPSLDAAENRGSRHPPGRASQAKGFRAVHGRACLLPRKPPAPHEAYPGVVQTPTHLNLPPPPPHGGPRRSPEAGSALLSNGGGGEGRGPPRGESALNERFPRAFPCRLPSQMILAPPPPPPLPPPPALLPLPRLHLLPTPLA